MTTREILIKLSMELSSLSDNERRQAADFALLAITENDDETREFNKELTFKHFGICQGLRIAVRNLDDNANLYIGQK